MFASLWFSVHYTLRIYPLHNYTSRLLWPALGRYSTTSQWFENWNLPEHETIGCWSYLLWCLIFHNVIWFFICFQDMPLEPMKIGLSNCGILRQWLVQVTGAKLVLGPDCMIPYRIIQFRPKTGLAPVFR